MTYRTDTRIVTEHNATLDDARELAESYASSKGRSILRGAARDSAIRYVYRKGATMQQLADATGLTRARIGQIVSERQGAER